MKNQRSEEFYINKYGEEIGKQKYNLLLKSREKRETQQSVKLNINDPSTYVECKQCNKKFKRITKTHLLNNCTESITLDEYLNKYPNSNIVCDSLKEVSKFTHDFAILKYGKDLGEVKWKEYCDKQALTNTFEYKAKKYKMSLDEFNEYNKSRAVTLDNLVKKYGENIGLDKWNQYCERQKYTTSIEYFIKKYGDEGRDKWEKFCIARGNSSNLEFIQTKYNVSLEEAEKILSNRYTTDDKQSSDNEKKFIDALLIEIPDIKYTYKTRQFCIWNFYTNSPMFYDATCPVKKKIIEYNGDYWHANPSMYTENFLIKQSNMSASDIWKKDSYKKQAAIDRGFDVFVVWESEYISDKSKIINNLKEWWNK